MKLFTTCLSLVLVSSAHYLSAGLVFAQEFTCPVNQCTYNQSRGTSSSISVSTASSIGVSSSAKSGSKLFSSGSSASLGIGGLDGSSFVDQSVGYSSELNVDSNNRVFTTQPITLGFTSTSTSSDSFSTAVSADAVETVAGATDSVNSTSASGSSSEGNFDVSGIGGTQKLIFDPSSDFTANVTSSSSADSIGGGGGSGDAYANSNSSTSVNASINSSTYTNAFISSF